MKKVNKVCLSLLVVLSLSLSSQAQWYKLHHYQNPFLGYGGCNTLYLPLGPYPAGNGVILYGTQCQPTSPSGSIDISESKNDLDTSVTVFNNSGAGCCAYQYYSGFSKNDSVHCFIYDNAGSISLSYTPNNFKTISSLGGFMPSSPPTPACFSPGYVYYVTHYSSVASDSLFIYRVNPPTKASYLSKNFKYTSVARLSFTTDSTGYMLCIHRNDSARVLAKTSDSGKTWRDSFLDSVHIITSFYFPTPAIGYLTENNGNIYKTTDAGNTWVQLTSPTTIALNCVSFSNTTNGYVGGVAGNLFKTTNGGTSWTTETSGDTNSIYSLYTFDTVAYFIDANYNIYKNMKPLGIEKLQAKSPFANVFPNPSNGIFSVELKMNSEKLKIEVYSMLGEKIESQSVIGNSQFVIDLSSQPNGIYLYRITSEAGDYTISGKLVIQK
jgi:hypothetical protein